MSYEPNLITPFLNSGLSQFFKPFLVGDQAFPDIEDAYPWRGSVRKREGYRLFATLPTTPVQGLKSWINPSTLVPNLIAFSLTKSYGYNVGGGAFVDITQLANPVTAFSFGNGAFDYYWTTNFAGSMWMTNGLGYTAAGASYNGIFYLTNNAINSWNLHTPTVTGGGTPIYLNGALIIIAYKGRLVALNTIEGIADGSNNQTFSNRARWSQLGNPYVTLYNTKAAGTAATAPPAPFAPGDDKSWRSDIPGRGGFVDADTSERIVSAAIVKDILIVTFQRSTWRLRYTGNEVLPFIWERINTQYGAESTHSAIPFDDSALFFSRFGYIGSSTNEVKRIDETIPDVCFAFESGNSSFSNLSTVQGIRDYYRQMAYWTYSSIKGTVDNQIYAYNYTDKSWSVYNPTNQINCFGEFYNVADTTWSAFSAVDDIWANFNDPDDTWKNLGSSQNLGFPYIIGGDRASGKIWQMFEFDNPATSDDGTSFNFYIQTKRFNPYFSAGQKCRMGYVDLYVTTNTYGEINFQHFIDDKADPVFNRNVALYPRGVMIISTITAGATTTVVSASAHNLISNQQVVFSNITGTMGNALNNQTVAVTVVNSTTFTVPIVTIGLTSTGNGYFWSPPFDPGDSKYTRIYLGGIGYHHQFVITLTDNQMLDPVKSRAQFELQGLVIWTRPTGLIRG
jgi:hypothetical protein